MGSFFNFHRTSFPPGGLTRAVVSGGGGEEEPVVAGFEFLEGIGRLEGGSAQGDLKSEYGTAVSMTAWQTGRLRKVGYQSQGNRGQEKYGGNSYGKGNGGRYTMDIYTSKNNADKTIDWDNKIGEIDNAQGYYEPGTLIGVNKTDDFVEFPMGYEVGWLQVPIKSTADGSDGCSVTKGQKIWMVRRNIADSPAANFSADNHHHQWKVGQPDYSGVTVGGDNQGTCFYVTGSAQSQSITRDWRKRPVYSQQYIGQTDFYGHFCYLGQTQVDDDVTSGNTKDWGSIRTIYSHKTNSGSHRMVRQKYATSANFTERRIRNIWVNAVIRKDWSDYTNYDAPLELRVIESGTTIIDWQQIPASQFGISNVFHVQGGDANKPDIYQTIGGVQRFNVYPTGKAVLPDNGFLMKKSTNYIVELRVNPSNTSTSYFINACQHPQSLVGINFTTMLSWSTNCRAEYTRNSGTNWYGWAYRAGTSVAVTDPLEQRSDLVLGIYMTP